MVYIQNAIYYMRSPGPLWNGAPSLFRWPVQFAALLLAGLQRLCRRSSIADFYVLASLIPVILSSFGRADRYRLPVYPLFCMYGASGLWRLAAALEPRSRSLATSTAALVIVVGATMNILAAERGPIQEGVGKLTFQAA